MGIGVGSGEKERVIEAARKKLFTHHFRNYKLMVQKDVIVNVTGGFGYQALIEAEEASEIVNQAAGHRWK